MRKLLIIGDVHAPFHNRKYLSLALQIGKKLKINELIINGDLVDFHNISKYGKNPKVKENFRNELDGCKDVRNLICDVFPNDKKTLLISNHENRINTFINNRCQQFFDVVTFDNLLQFKEHGFNVIDYSNKQAYHITCDLYCRHEPPPGQLTTMLGKSFVSLICSHTHRIYSCMANGLDGNIRRLYSIGHLADVTHPALDYLKFKEQWLPGFAIIYDYGSYYVVENVEILSRGNTFVAQVAGVRYEI